MANILIVNGPNLNLLGTREPEVYGNETLDDVRINCEKEAKALGHTTTFVQSNSEAELIDILHAARDKSQFIVINPAAFTHTSVAIRDAILGINIPFIEVHISNVHQREAFRHHSFFSDVAQGVICGLGTQGYLFAVQAANSYLKKS